MPARLSSTLSPKSQSCCLIFHENLLKIFNQRFSFSISPLFNITTSTNNSNYNIESNSSWNIKRRIDDAGDQNCKTKFMFALYLQFRHLIKINQISSFILHLLVPPSLRHSTILPFSTFLALLIPQLDRPHWLRSKLFNLNLANFNLCKLSNQCSSIHLDQTSWSSLAAMERYLWRAMGLFYSILLYLLLSRIPAEIPFNLRLIYTSARVWTNLADSSLPHKPVGCRCFAPASVSCCQQPDRAVWKR